MKKIVELQTGAVGAADAQPVRGVAADLSATAGERAVRADRRADDDGGRRRREWQRRRLQTAQTRCAFPGRQVRPPVHAQNRLNTFLFSQYPTTRNPVISFRKKLSFERMIMIKCFSSSDCCVRFWAAAMLVTKGLPGV